MGFEINVDRILDAKNGNGGVEINKEEGKEADVLFKATDSDLYDILTGELDPTQAYFAVSCTLVLQQTSSVLHPNPPLTSSQGKLTVEGSLMLAMKLSKFQKPAEPSHEEL